MISASEKIRLSSRLTIIETEATMNLTVLELGGLLAGSGLLMMAYTIGRNPHELIPARHTYFEAAFYRQIGKAFCSVGLIICLLSLLIP
jgi:hypothetical protein